MLQVLAGLGIFAALLMSVVALTRTGGQSNATAAPQHASATMNGMSEGSMSGGSMTPASNGAQSAPSASAQVVDLKIVPSGKLGSDGKKHDAYTVTDFHVKAGQPVTLHINNEDDMPHSISAPEAGVNIVVQHGTHDYTLKVDKTGKFEWHCDLPCDDAAGGWAMSHTGFMAGYITAS